MIVGDKKVGAGQGGGSEAEVFAEG
jgi:hypothetical protein